MDAVVFMTSYLQSVCKKIRIEKVIFHCKYELDAKMCFAI